MPKPKKNGEVFKTTRTGRGITRLVEGRVFLAEYQDGDNRPQNRLVVTVPGEKGLATFIMQERIGGTLVAAPANAWFAKQMAEILEPSSTKRSSRSSASDEEATSI